MSSHKIFRRNTSKRSLKIKEHKKINKPSN